MRLVTAWKWFVIIIGGLTVLLVIDAARGVTLGPIPNGHYSLTWSMPALTVNGVDFDTLRLEGDVTSAVAFEFSGILQASSNGGAYAVRASCYKNAEQGIFCTLTAPDRNLFLTVAHDGIAVINNVGLPADVHYLTRITGN